MVGVGAPVALTALRRRDGDRERPYKLPLPAVLSPVGFVAANLIVYRSTFEANWKLLVAIAFGLVLFGVTYMLTSPDKRLPRSRPEGMDLGSSLARRDDGDRLSRRYGTTAQKILPEWVDLAVGRRIQLGHLLLGCQSRR
ncbi:MAG: hypothetical protein ACR2JG_13420 [Geodermatophilaceae bacterium]